MGFSRQEYWSGVPLPSLTKYHYRLTTHKFIAQAINWQFQLSSVQSLSHVRLFITPRTAACQASLSITNSWSLLKLMSIELVMPSNHLILCSLLLFPPSIFPSSFQMSQLFKSGGQSTGVSASTSVLPMNIQDWSPLGWPGWISLQSKGLSRVFSNTTLQKHQFFSLAYPISNRHFKFLTCRPDSWSTSKMLLP